MAPPSPAWIPPRLRSPCTAAALAVGARPRVVLATSDFIVAPRSGVPRHASIPWQHADVTRTGAPMAPRTSPAITIRQIAEKAIPHAGCPGAGGRRAFVAVQHAVHSLRSRSSTRTGSGGDLAREESPIPFPRPPW